jgi:hypothetical protein
MLYKTKPWTRSLRGPVPIDLGDIPPRAMRSVIELEPDRLHDHP